MPWTDNVSGSEWHVTVHWAVLDGRAIPVGIDVHSFERDRPMSTGLAEVNREVIKRLPVAAVIERSRDRVKWLTKLAESAPTSIAAEAREQERLMGSRPKNPGRQFEHTDDHYRRVAALYEEALAVGGKPRRSPALYVLERLRAEGVYVTGGDQMRKWVAEARKRGHLPPYAGPNL